MKNDRYSRPGSRKDSILNAALVIAALVFIGVGAWLPPTSASATEISANAQA